MVGRLVKIQNGIFEIRDGFQIWHSNRGVANGQHRYHILQSTISHVLVKLNLQIFVEEFRMMIIYVIGIFENLRERDGKCTFFIFMTSNAL